ncbi:MAG: hypothetical protein IJG94_11125 [Clostridia bacterium]|jgi:hypothetical protein|nr:hypothetical protein [Clostridia bacterium]
MDNKKIYQLTLGFSLRRLGWDMICFLMLAAVTAAGFYGAEKVWNKGLIGLGVGFTVGLILLAIVTRFISYTYKAGQIAMMTKGVTEGELPEDVIGEGKKIVKERFATVAGFFAVTGLIKGIFNQIGRAISKLGENIGGDTGNAVGSAVSGVINTIISYLCDCCLGWVFYRKEEKATKATLQGAGIFFKHGKTFFKNMGRIFGIGLASLIVIGGAFFGIAYLILKNFPQLFERLAKEITESIARGDTTTTSNAVRDIITNPNSLMIAAAVLCGLIIWSFLHSTFIRPFVLVGVLRNYMASGMQDLPTEETYASIARISPKFAKLQTEV